ncbi:hypothetical protein KPH14_009859 [Odynerus spinipes]|uniref:Uncharacterized protein n=1 Tax=Odynerus spinipes TaxID=1348599 RepID=A0AAD9RVX6_9HYME|nr:hypothetical protein KPH14_009859 [Odynerus spinipes]
MHYVLLRLVEVRRVIAPPSCSTPNQWTRAGQHGDSVNVYTKRHQHHAGCRAEEVAIALGEIPQDEEAKKKEDAR